MKIRIFLTDDHAVVRAGLRKLLESEPDMEVVGEAGDGRTAVKSVPKLAPDVVVMDMGMPDMNGIEAARQIRAGVFEGKIICLSMHRERRIVEAAMGVGMSGYVLKEDAPKTLAEAIRTVVNGGGYLSPKVAMDVLKSGARRETETGQEVFSKLSGREVEVLQLIAEGFTTKEIGVKLELSAKTVAVHREHIMKKLNLHSNVALTRYALREGLTQL